MSKPNDGGPAFPVAFSTAGWHSGNVNVGMTLRDWFAGQALNGMLADDCTACTWAKFSERAYACADAMIAEREEEGAEDPPSVCGPSAGQCDDILGRSHYNPHEKATHE